MKHFLCNKKTIIMVLVALCMALACGCSGGSSGSGSESDLNNGDGSSLDDVIAIVCDSYIDTSTDPDPMDDEAPWMVYTGVLCGTKEGVHDWGMIYYDNLRAYLKTHDGQLDENKYTSYEKAALAVASLGEDPRDVEGYDLIKKTDDYENVKEQGVNAEIHALTVKNYTGNELKNEKKYIEDILSSRKNDGGMALFGDEGDVDITAMAIQALAPYAGAEPQAVSGIDPEEVSEAVSAGEKFLSEKMTDDCDYGSSESISQVIMALCALGEDPADAKGFTKDGKNLLDGLMKYRTEDGFSHVAGEDTNGMATRQALMALCAVRDLGKHE